MFDPLAGFSTFMSDDGCCGIFKREIALYGYTIILNLYEEQPAMVELLRAACACYLEKLARHQ
jgi:hypothetical protein